MGKRFHIPARGQAWAVVQFDSGRDALQKAEQFARNLYDSMSALGAPNFAASVLSIR